jgi:hypothetical protein
MESDEFVRCPLCDGLAKLWRSDLIALLTGKNLREKLQKNMAEFLPPAEADQAARRLPGEFEKEVSQLGSKPSPVAQEFEGVNRDDRRCLPPLAERELPPGPRSKLEFL